MPQKVRIHELSFKFSRGIGRRLAASLAVGLLLVAGMRESRADANSHSVSASAQDQKRLAAQKKFDEGEALSEQRTAESLRLALKKYEAALLLWRFAGGARDGEARTLEKMGLVYFSLGEPRKALDLLTQALTIQREAGDRLAEAITLNTIGYVYQSLDESQKAIELFHSGAVVLARNRQA